MFLYIPFMAPEGRYVAEGHHIADSARFLAFSVETVTRLSGCASQTHSNDFERTWSVWHCCRIVRPVPELLYLGQQFQNDPVIVGVSREGPCWFGVYGLEILSC